MSKKIITEMEYLKKANKNLPNSLLANVILQKNQTLLNELQETYEEEQNQIKKENIVKERIQVLNDQFKNLLEENLEAFKHIFGHQNVKIKTESIFTEIYFYLTEYHSTGIKNAEITLTITKEDFQEGKFALSFNNSNKFGNYEKLVSIQVSEEDISYEGILNDGLVKFLDIIYRPEEFASSSYYKELYNARIQRIIDYIKELGKTNVFSKFEKLDGFNYCIESSSPQERSGISFNDRYKHFNINCFFVETDPKLIIDYCLNEKVVKFLCELNGKKSELTYLYLEDTNYFVEENKEIESAFKSFIDQSLSFIEELQEELED